MNNESDEKPCCYCSEWIPSTATLCKHCNHHQFRPKNWSSWGFLFTLIAAVLVFAFQYAYQEISTWDDVTRVELLAVSALPDGTAVILNSGDRNVFVKSITLECPALKFSKCFDVHTIAYANDQIRTPIGHPTRLIRGYEYIGEEKGDAAQKGNNELRPLRPLLFDLYLCPILEKS